MADRNEAERIGEWIWRQLDKGVKVTRSDFLQEFAGSTDGDGPDDQKVRNLLPSWNRAIHVVLGCLNAMGETVENDDGALVLRHEQ